MEASFRNMASATRSQINKLMSDKKSGSMA
jgi:hypothetical protein